MNAIWHRSSSLWQQSCRHCGVGWEESAASSSDSWLPPRVGCVVVHHGTSERFLRTSVELRGNEATALARGEPPAIFVTRSYKEAREYAGLRPGSNRVLSFHLRVAVNEVLAVRRDGPPTELSAAVQALRHHNSAMAPPFTEGLSGHVETWASFGEACRRSGVVALRYSPRNLAVLEPDRLHCVRDYIE